MTPNAMSRPTAAQLSNSSDGQGTPVAAELTCWLYVQFNHNT